MTEPVTHETEIKIRLAAAADHARLRDALGEPAGVVDQHNLFLDTPDRQLGAAGLALRLRLEESGGGSPRRHRSALMAVKGRSTRFAGAVHRTDIEVPLEVALWEAAAQQGGLHPAELEGPPMDFLRSQVELEPHALFEVIVDFYNQRTRYPVTLAGESLDLLLDRTSFGTGEIDHEIEVEVEVAGGLEQPENELLIRLIQRDLTQLLAAHGVTTAPSRGGKFSRSLHYADQSR